MININIKTYNNINKSRYIYIYILYIIKNYKKYIQVGGIGEVHIYVKRLAKTTGEGERPRVI